MTWQSPMSIFVIGFNHKTASIETREKAYFAKDKLSIYLQDLLNQGYTQEAVLLSTCNRSELYFEASNATPLYDWFYHHANLTRDQLNACCYQYCDEEAVAHLMTVACGLDSMILGEPQILGQLKEAFTESCSVGAVGATFHLLFKHIFSVAKEVRSTTAIGACPVSVASTAVRFASQQVAHFAEAKVLILGAGDTTELLLRYLQPQLKHPISLVNRSIEKISVLAHHYRTAHVYRLEQLHEALLTPDLVFSATGSAMPLVTRQMVSEVMLKRHAPLLFIDIAVPRDVDPLVVTVPYVTLYCIDDLKKIIENNLRDREHAALKAHEMIRNRSHELMMTYRSTDKVTTTITAYRKQIEAICQAELIKAKQQLRDGMDPLIVVEDFAYAYTKKLLHTPSVQLRQAGAQGRLELLNLVKQLFAIEDTELELDPL